MVATAASLGDQLQAAFRGEVAQRLPRLRALLADEPVELEQVRRDAHTLASSAVVVGLPAVAVVAREVERLLEAGLLAELPPSLTQLIGLLA